MNNHNKGPFCTKIFKGVSDLESNELFCTSRKVVKIWIFPPICLKWHAGEENLATSQKTFGLTTLATQF